MAIVFGMCAAATGWNVPNDVVAEHVRRAPRRLVFFACPDPGRPGFIGGVGTLPPGTWLPRGEAGADLSRGPSARPAIPRDLRILPAARPADHHPHGHDVFQRRAAGVRPAGLDGSGGRRVSRIEDRAGPPRTPVGGGDDRGHPKAAAPVCRHFRPVLPAVAVLQRHAIGGGVSCGIEAAVRLRLSGNHHRAILGRPARTSMPSWGRAGCRGFQKRRSRASSIATRSRCWELPIPERRPYDESSHRPCGRCGSRRSAGWNWWSCPCRRRRRTKC